MTEQSSESSQPGRVLRAAREEMSLTLEQVAVSLHLRPAVVKAIEEEKYSEFSSDVFLKGYFRSYCRLVKLNEDRMIALLDQQLGVINQKSEQVQMDELKQIHARKRKKTFTTFFVLLISAALIFLAYKLWSDSDLQISHSIQSEVEDVEPPTGEYSSPVLEPDVIETEDVLNVDAGDSDNDQYPSETETVYENELDEPSFDSAEVIEEMTVQNEILDAENLRDKMDIQDLSLPLESDQSYLSRLYAQFSGDCWFKLTDASGKTVIADLKKETDVVDYQGQAPFHLVLGDSTKVVLSFEGKLIDLNPYSSRNGRAELTLVSSKSKSTQMSVEG